MEKSADDVTDPEVLNDTITAALKLAGLMTDDGVEQTQFITVETCTDNTTSGVLAEVDSLEGAGLTTEEVITVEAVADSNPEACADQTQVITVETGGTAGSIFEGPALTEISEACTEQTQVIAVEDSILEVTTSEDNLQGTIIVILPQEDLGVQQKEIDEQEVHTSNDDDEYFTCSNCNDVFTDSKKFHEHKCLKVVELDDFLCKDCGKVCTDDSSLKIHAATHLKQKEKEKMKNKFECKTCKKEFSHKWSRENHSCHSKRFMCEFCGMGYGRKGDMKRHILSVHTKTKQFQCKSCDKKFATKWHLALHEQVHTRGKAFQCQICGKRYSQKSHLERHKCVHSEDSVKCTDCSAWFVNKSVFSLHTCKAKKNRQPLRFACHLCKKTFSRKYDLKRHQFLHTDNKPLPCKYCEKSFVTSWHLKHHERSHTGEKPYHCHCGKQFKQKSHLDNHQISHASHVYRCKHCKRRFSKKESLARHENTHFKNKGLNDQENVNDSGLDTALECLLGFANESDKATEITSETVSSGYNEKVPPVTTEMVSTGDKEKCPSVTSRTASCGDNYKRPSVITETVRSHDNEKCSSMIETVSVSSNDNEKHSSMTNKSVSSDVNEKSSSITTETVGFGDNENVSSVSNGCIGGVASKPNKTSDKPPSSIDNCFDNEVSRTSNTMCTRSGGTDKLEAAYDNNKNICKYCNRVYQFRARLLKHYMTHTAFHFDTDTSFLSPQESEYLDACGKVKLFICLGCNRTYSNEDQCNIHKLKCNAHLPTDPSEPNQTPFEEDGDDEQSIDGELVCKVCKKVFLSEQKYRQHISYHRRRSVTNVFVKSGEPPVKMMDIKLLFVCSYCGKEFAYKTSFERHEYQHQQYLGADKPKVAYMYICSKCGKDFRRITHLKRHMLLHKENESPKNKMLLRAVQENVQKESEEPLVHTTVLAKSDATTPKIPTLHNELVKRPRPVRKGNLPKRYRSESVDLQKYAGTSVNSLTVPSTSYKKPIAELQSLIIQETKTNSLKEPSQNPDTSTNETNPSEADKCELIKSPPRTIRPIRIRNTPKRYRIDLECLQRNAAETLVNPINKQVIKGGCATEMDAEECKKVRKSKRTPVRLSNRNSNECINDKGNSNCSQMPTSVKTRSKRFQNSKQTKIIKQPHKSVKTKPQITFDCKRCKKEFILKTSLNRHMRHDSKRPLVCKMCCRRFGVQESLSRHEAAHAGTYLLSCDVCGKGFNHRNTLEIHVQKHTGNRNHMCDVCGKMFVSKYNLKSHTYIHSGESPNVCKFCGKHYGRKNDLRRHELSHEGSKPFSCSLCERKFVHRWHLRYHEKSHVNKKPFASN